MNPFQSSNIWKRAAREKRQAEQPKTPEQIWRGELISTSLWLTGGVAVLALLAAAVRSSILLLNGENGIILAVVGLYTLYNATALGRLWKDRPRK